MWELNHKESWAPKYWCFLTLELENTLESPLDCKEIKPVNPKGNQPWIFIGKIDAKAEAPILWPPDVKSWLTGKDPDAGKNRRQKEKKEAEGWMVRQPQRLNGHKFEQTPGDSEGQGSLAYYSSWGSNWTREQQKEKTYRWLTSFHLFAISLYPIETYFTRITYLSKLVLSQQLQCSICFQ